ncbi:hypothetical protein [Rhizobium bangladeshense]|uniref:hypothetical protein n=1 Tax=Rhizobium bangladeshense TaxID=1138189 RepID=UPI001C82EF46|nr:hypothetical protein [Rhizobium bangladeshense]
MAYKIVFFIARLATALALGGAMAHLLELPNKIRLARNDYFVVQKAYRGWDRLAFLLLIQLTAIVSVAIMSRHEPSVFLACRRFGAEPAWCSSGVWGLYLPRECGDEELDRYPGQLGNAAYELGILARSRSRVSGFSP